MHNSPRPRTATRLIVGLGTTGTSVVEKFRRENALEIGESGLRIETRDQRPSGLDASYRLDDAELAEIGQVTGDVSDLLIVASAGGNTGAAQARFFALCARSRSIRTTAAICTTLKFEGRIRTARSSALIRDLTSMHVDVRAIGGEEDFQDDLTSVEDSFSRIDAKLSKVIRDWVSGFPTIGSESLGDVSP
jgi:cell division GTPase FtsZ